MATIAVPHSGTETEQERAYRSFVFRYQAFAFFRGFHFFSAVLVPFFTEWAGISVSWVVWIQSWFWFWQFALEVPTGTVADRWGRKTSLVLGAASTVLAVLVYGSYPHLAVFLVGELLFALGAALISGADEALLYDRLIELNRSDQMTKHTTRATFYHLAGVGLSAPLGGLLVTQFDLNVPMLLTAVPALIALVIGWTLGEPKIKQHEAETGEKTFRRLFETGVLAVIREPKLWPYILSTTTFALSGYFTIWLYQPRLEQLGVGPEWFGWFHVVFVGVEMVILWYLDRIKRWFGVPKLLLVAAVLSSIGFATVALIDHWFAVVILLTFTGAVGLSFSPSLSNEVNGLIESQTRGTSLSTVRMSSHVARFSGNIILGFFIAGYLQPTLLVLAILPLLALVVWPKFRVSSKVETSSEREL